MDAESVDINVVIDVLDAAAQAARGLARLHGLSWMGLRGTKLAECKAELKDAADRLWGHWEAMGGHQGDLGGALAIVDAIESAILGAGGV